MNPFRELGLHGNESSAEVKEAWHKLASIHHPDKGGDPAEFSRLRKAYSDALKEATERELTCPKCGGTGLARVSHGFATVLMSCDKCGGSGEYQ